MTIDKEHKTETISLPRNLVYRRFHILTIIALVLIAVLIWFTLAVLEANDIEAELQQLAAAAYKQK